MQSPKTIETVDVSKAKNLQELKDLVNRQIKIIEAAYRRLYNDVAKLRTDMNGYHP